MTSRLTLRSAAPSGGAAWELDAIPLAYEEAGKAQFHSMPGCRWMRDPRSPNGRGFYRGPAEAVRMIVALLESAGVIRVTTDPDANTVPLGARSIPIDPVGLREYQREGAAWCASMVRHTGAALLADEMGIGKSAQAIRAVDALGSGAVLIVCPAIVRRHWEAQCKRWSVAASHERYFHIMSYECFTKLAKQRALPAVSFAIIDEIHYVANPTSQRSKALHEWRAGAGRHVGIVGLSGTPMTVRPRDLWSPLELLWPGRFGRQYDFQKRYCNGHYEEIPKIEKSVWVCDGASRTEELAIRLAAVMLRRTKGAVGLELPARTRTVIEVELPAKASRDLQRASAAIDWNRPNGASISSLLSDVEAYKIDAAEALAREALAAGSRPLIFTTRKATAEALGKRLQAPVVHGEVAADSRQDLLCDAPCGVATMYSVTTGIDLVGFDVAIFVGLDWVPSTVLQAESRVHRIGQQRSVSVYFLVGLRTLDEVVRSKVIERLDQFAALAGGAGDEREFAGDLAGGSDDDLLAEFAAACGGGKP